MSTTTFTGGPGDLIAGVHADLADADDLARVREAARRAQVLGDAGERLVDHFVAAARAGGSSWEAVAEALGTSEGAAQTRATANPFDRFTELCRHSIVVSQESARTRRHELIGTGHLLLGLLDEQRGRAHGLLTASTSERAVRDAVEALLPAPGRQEIAGHIPFDEPSKEAIEHALGASGDLGHDWVGTEHLLLGLVRAQQSTAAQVLAELGFDADELHDAVRVTADQGA